MIRLPPRSTRTDTLFPYTTLFRSELEKVDIDVSDKAAMQDGARTFANYCMGCHSAKFQRYERVADDLGIPHELMLEKLVFTGAKLGAHMHIGMKPADDKRSEERRVGKECVRTCRSRGSP